MEPCSKVPATADQSSLNTLHKLLIACFRLLKVIANTSQVNSATVNSRMRTVDRQHDITVPTISVAFLVNERDHDYFFCYEIKRALPVSGLQCGGLDIALPSDFRLPVKWTVWKQLMELVK
jgi:hypothetical protein